MKFTKDNYTQLQSTEATIRINEHTVIELISSEWQAKNKGFWYNTIDEFKALFNSSYRTVEFYKIVKFRVLDYSVDSKGITSTITKFETSKLIKPEDRNDVISILFGDNDFFNYIKDLTNKIQSIGCKWVVNNDRSKTSYLPDYTVNLFFDSFIKPEEKEEEDDNICNAHGTKLEVPVIFSITRPYKQSILIEFKSLEHFKSIMQQIENLIIG